MVLLSKQQVGRSKTTNTASMASSALQKHYTVGEEKQQQVDALSQRVTQQDERKYDAQQRAFG
jgi:hypothetical protein